MTTASSEGGELEGPTWFGAQADGSRLLAFGFRLKGGGAHQSKTMMLRELESLLAPGRTKGDELKFAAIKDNALGKSTANTRRLTFQHMASLYGLLEQPPITAILFKLWQSDPEGHRLQALLASLARDPLLRETAKVVLNQPVGQTLERPLFEDALLAAFPSRFSENTAAASTWPRPRSRPCWIWPRPTGTATATIR